MKLTFSKIIKPFAFLLLGLLLLSFARAVEAPWSYVLLFAGFAMLFVAHIIAPSRRRSASTMEEWEEAGRRKNCALSIEELAKLDDDELVFAVADRMRARVDRFGEGARGLEWLSEPQRLFCALYWLENEVYQEGFFSFFTHESRMVAPWVSEYMETVGAIEHKRLYDTFVSEHGLDLNDLSCLEAGSEAEQEEKQALYHFAELDNAFWELTVLDELLAKYIRAHISEF